MSFRNRKKKTHSYYSRIYLKIRCTYNSRSYAGFEKTTVSAICLQLCFLNKKMLWVAPWILPWIFFCSHQSWTLLYSSVLLVETVSFHTALGMFTHSLPLPLSCFTFPLFFYCLLLHFIDKTTQFMLITGSSIWPYCEKKLCTGLVQKRNLIPAHGICPSSLRPRE